MSSDLPDNQPGIKKKQGERNPSASLQQKLRNHARATGEEVALVLIRYLNERFLYRLSLSPHRDRFVLRGATLFTVWDKEPHRATRDIDLLASGDNSADGMRQMVEAICAQPVEADDGLTFLPETLNIEERIEGRIYQGLHLEMAARLGTAQLRLEIDIAFGEAVIPLRRIRTTDPPGQACAPLARLPEGDGHCGEVPGVGRSGPAQHAHEGLL